MTAVWESHNHVGNLSGRFINSLGLRTLKEKYRAYRMALVECLERPKDMLGDDISSWDNRNATDDLKSDVECFDSESLNCCKDDMRCDSDCKLGYNLRETAKRCQILADVLKTKKYKQNNKVSSYNLYIA